MDHTGDHIPVLVQNIGAMGVYAGLIGLYRQGGIVGPILGIGPDDMLVHMNDRFQFEYLMCI